MLNYCKIFVSLGNHCSWYLWSTLPNEHALRPLTCFKTLKCKEHLCKQITPSEKICKNNDIPLLNPRIKVFDKMLKKCLLLGNVWKHLKENCLFYTNSSDIWFSRPFYYIINNHIMLCTGRFLFIYNKCLAWDKDIY